MYDHLFEQLSEAGPGHSIQVCATGLDVGLSTIGAQRATPTIVDHDDLATHTREQLEARIADEASWLQGHELTGLDVPDHEPVTVALTSQALVMSDGSVSCSADVSPCVVTIGPGRHRADADPGAPGAITRVAGGVATLLIDACHSPSGLPLAATIPAIGAATLAMRYPYDYLTSDDIIMDVAMALRESLSHASEAAGHPGSTAVGQLTGVSILLRFAGSEVDSMMRTVAVREYYAMPQRSRSLNGLSSLLSLSYGVVTRMVRSAQETVIRAVQECGVSVEEAARRAGMPVEAAESVLRGER